MTLQSLFNDIFVESFHGSIVVDCACGRRHFVSQGDYDEGEYESLTAKQQEDPDRFIESDESHISIVDIGSDSYVPGCPCEWEHTYANFLSKEMGKVLRFYDGVRKEIDEEIERALKAKEAIGKIKPKEDSSIVKLGSIVEVAPSKRGLILELTRQGYIAISLDYNVYTIFYILKENRPIQVIGELSMIEMLTHECENIRTAAKRELELNKGLK